GVAARVDREAEVIRGIIAGRVHREAPRGTVLEALVHRQDHQLAGAGETPGVEEPGDVGAGTGTVAAVPAADLLHARFDRLPPPFRSRTLSTIELVGHRHVVGAAANDGGALVVLGGHQVQRALEAGAGPAARLLHHQAHRGHL